MRLNHVLLYSCCALLAACGTKPIKPSDKHVMRDGAEPPHSGSIPQAFTRAIPLAPPQAAAKVETYSVVVTNVPAHEILFALSRDAKINLDIHGGIQGSVTLNAVNQTLPQILNRIAKQIDMRYEMDGDNLIVMPDTPFLHTYKVDYLNMARDSNATASISTQISTVGTGAQAGAGPSGGGNSSTTSISNSTKNDFWKTLVQNIKDILHETDKVLPPGSSETSVEQVRTASSTGTGTQPANNKKYAATKEGVEVNTINVEEGGLIFTRRSTFREAASVIANPENGIISVRATSRQHERIQEFLDQIMASARRQVLIEATVVEVSLNDQYQAGIDWSRLASGGSGMTFVQAFAGSVATAGVTPFLMKYANPNANFGGNISGTVKLLSSFGDTRILSSPKIMALNNQTALLKVVDEKVYFTVDVTITEETETKPERRRYISYIHTVPVGLVMSVTPQISDNDTVSLNVRPTVSRITGYKTDPAAALEDSGIKNEIPEIQVREMESLLNVSSGQIVVLGGLMEDSVAHSTDGIPLLSKLPLIGNLFSYRNDRTTKTELVIFLRPIIIKDASINGDFSGYRDSLPSPDFFKSDAAGKNDLGSKSY